MKIVRMLACFSLLICSMAALATNPPLVSYNNAAIDSTLRIMSGNNAGMCATTLDSTAFVRTNESKTTQDYIVSLMCRCTKPACEGSAFPCKADIFLDPKHNCSGEYIGSVELSKEGYVTVTNIVPGHDLIGGAHTMTVNY